MSHSERSSNITSNTDGVSRREFQHHNWTIVTQKSHILESKCVHPDTCSIAEQQDQKCLFCQFDKMLEIPHLPDMTFARNLLRVQHRDGYGIEFTALDALKEVKKRAQERVHASEEWLKSREQYPEAQLIKQNFDWTFTTEYVGTLLPDACDASQLPIPSSHQSTGGGLLPVRRRVKHVQRIVQESEPQSNSFIQIQSSPIGIDLDRLRVKEEILFFDEIDLFEDELADNGVSRLSVRIRVMPDKIYILMRFYLRVDRIKVKVYDTRVYFEEGNNFVHRDITRHEADLQQVHPTVLGNILDANEFVTRIRPQLTINQRLVFPDKSNLEGH